MTIPSYSRQNRSLRMNNAVDTQQGLDVIEANQDDIEAINRNSALDAVASAPDVPTLCRALNEFEGIRKETHGDDAENIPVFSEEPEVDWSNFADEAVSCDQRFVLFREQATRRYYFMSRADVESKSE